MSLVVQVNNTSGSGSSPTATAAAKKAAVAVAASTPQQPTRNVVAPAGSLMPQPQPPTIAITSIAEQQTQAATAAAVAAQQHQQHIVQHHPPPLGGVAAGRGDTAPRLRMIHVPQLPQSPVPPVAHHHSTIGRHAPQVTTAHVRLPQAPVRQHHLPQVPHTAAAAAAAASIQQHHHRILQQLPQAPQPRPVLVSASAAAVSSASRQHPQPPSAHLSSMLPQAPSTLIPSMPFPSNLSPHPPSAAIVSGAKILPPMTSPSAALQQHLLATARPHPPTPVTIRGPMQHRGRRRNNSTDELDDQIYHAGAAAAHHQHHHHQILHQVVSRGHQPQRIHLPQHHSPLTAAAFSAAAASSSSRSNSSGRSGQQLGSPRTGRGSGVGSRNSNWQQCSALQDHNYASKPPATPPPSPATVQQAHEAASRAAAVAAASVNHFPSPSPQSFLPQTPNPPTQSGTTILLSNQQPHPAAQPPQPAAAAAGGPAAPSGGLTLPSPSSFSGSSAAFGLLHAAALANNPVGLPQSPLIPQQPPIMVQAAASNAANSPSSQASLPTPPTRDQQNTHSIEEAGVGPMAPLSSASPDSGKHSTHKGGDKDSDVDDEEDNRRSEEAGEETETAPEAEQEEEEEDDDDDEEEDDSITRCICDFLHDDGYMICCDKCSVWQHVSCMGLDKNHIPEEYLCEVCKPRPVDRKRAKALQARRRTEIFHANSSSSDNDATANNSVLKSKHGKSKKANSSSNKRILDRKAELPKSSKVKGGSAAQGLAGKFGKSLLGSKVGDGNKNKKGGSLLDKNKQYRKRKPSEPSGKVSKVKKVPRRKSSQDDEDEDDEDSDTLLEPQVEASQHLRQWIDHYEEAVTNHYSPELRKRLEGNKVNFYESNLRASALGAPIKCNVSLKGNGVKILTANGNLPANTPVIEAKGRVMISSQYRSNSHQSPSNSPTKNSKHPANLNNVPFVLFKRLSDALEICVDGKTFGNDARFCRKSKQPNAELRHIMANGALHVFIVTVKHVDKNQEIVLPLDNRHAEGSPVKASAPLPSINADLREIKKPVNGMLSTSLLSSSSDEKPVKEKKKREKKKVKKSGAAMMASAALSAVEAGKEKRKTRNQKPQTVAHLDEDDILGMTPSPNSENEHSHNGDQMNNSNPSPASPNKGKPSPGKLGLPDNSGLIVGVNTINYDASSSLRNKAKSREERKMEMIMKAFEAMEKAEQRKKETEGGGGGSTSNHTADTRPLAQTKRRRSSVHKSNLQNNDSALEASSADEGGRPEPKRIARKKGRKSGPTTPQRRRSRVMSGESASAVSENESTNQLNDHPSSSTPNTANSNSNGPFRFPKTKKSMMSEWFDQNDDDDVSASYLRGSRSPPGIATHLLRSSAPHSPVKSVCAKKRWLRQAISEDHTEEQAVPTMSSPSITTNGTASPETNSSDYVTPLKKRRLASYKDDQQQREDHADEAAAVAKKEEEERDMTPPKEPVPNNSLKKKLLHNLVEAVLDRAMEDMLGPGAASASSTNETEELTIAPKQEEQKMEEEEESDHSQLSPPEEHKEEPEEEQEVKVEEEVKEEEMKEEEQPPPPTMEEEEEEEPKPVTRRSNKLKETLEEPETTSKPSPVPSTSLSIKTPEPSSVFKSFFQSTVSIEELEAELEASKRQREAEQREIEAKTSQIVEVKSQSPLRVTETKPEAAEATKVEEEAEIKQEEDAVKPESANAAPVSEEKPVIPQVTAKPEVPAPFVPAPVVTEVKPVEAKLEVKEPVKLPEQPPQPPKPKEKKRMSLADYKKRRKQESQSSVSHHNASLNTPPVNEKKVLPSLPPLLSSSSNLEDGPGTPTLDEGSTAPVVAAAAAASIPAPTLNPLPLFERLEKLEQAQMEINNKKKNATSHNSLTDSPTIAEPKREDLTERLKKEFGLTVDDDSDTNTPSNPIGLPFSLNNDGGDATPELDSVTPPAPPSLPSPLPSVVPAAPGGPPHPPPASHRYGGPPSQQNSFTPTQYPSYPPNYPLPPYPKPPPSSSSKYPSGPPHPPPPASSNYSTSQYGRSKEDSSKTRRDYYSSSSSSSSSTAPSYPPYPGSDSRNSDRRGGDGSRDRDLRGSSNHHRDHSRDYHHRDYHHRSDKSRGDSRASRHGSSDRGSGGYSRGGYYSSQQ